MLWLCMYITMFCEMGIPNGDIASIILRQSWVFKIFTSLEISLGVGKIVLILVKRYQSDDKALRPLLN